MNNRLHLAMAWIAGVASAAIVAIAPAAAADKLENIALAWKPTSPMAQRPQLDMKGIEGAKLQVEPFIDNRADKQLIGMNKGSIPNRKVTTQEDVARFVTYQVKTLMAAQGVPIVESGGRSGVSCRLSKFTTLSRTCRSIAASCDSSRPM